MSSICTLLVSGLRPKSKHPLSEWVTAACRSSGLPVFIEDPTYIPPCVSDRDVSTSLLVDFTDTPEYNNCEWLLDPSGTVEDVLSPAWQARWKGIATLLLTMQSRGYALRLYMGYDGALPDDFERVDLHVAQLPVFMADYAARQHFVSQSVCLTLLPAPEK